MSTHTHRHTLYNTEVEVFGQLVRVHSLLLPCASQAWSSGCQALQKICYLVETSHCPSALVTLNLCKTKERWGKWNVYFKNGFFFLNEEELPKDQDIIHCYEFRVELVCGCYQAGYTNVAFSE